MFLEIAWCKLVTVKVRIVIFWLFQRFQFVYISTVTEYCEKYAKKEHITNTTPEEESGDENISDEGSVSSDDDIAGHADP